jgi:AcrR family transcriptional regulator
MPKATKVRRPRRPLDREGIERAALELIDRDGLSELSMRRLGQKLGVEAMSLYHHYPSKGHLLDALLERLVASLDPIPPNLPWREQMWSGCHAYRGLATKHPKFAPFMITHRMNTRITLGWLEAFVRMFAVAGFDPESGARAFRAVSYYLMGAILDETSGYARGPTATETVPDDEQAVIAPTVTSYGPYFAKKHWDATFDAGLNALLDELERQLGRGKLGRFDDLEGV